jgi:hypothetical protein
MPFECSLRDARDNRVTRRERGVEKAPFDPHLYLRKLACLFPMA